MIRKLCALLAGMVTLGLVPWNAGAATANAGKYPRFTVTKLGGLGGSGSDAVAINNSGHVAGSATTAAGLSHAFLWRAGRMTDLGTLPGQATSYATGLNMHDQVIGYSGNLGFLWQDGRMTALSPLPGDTRTEVRAINNNGIVVGDSAKSAGSTQRAVTWRHGGAIALVTGVPGELHSVATGVNDRGQVVIESATINGVVPAVWTRRGAVTPASGFYGAGGFRINSKGLVAGNLYLGDPFYVWHLFLWQAGSGNAVRVPKPTADADSIIGINGNGTVISLNYPTFGEGIVSTIWQHGRPSDMFGQACGCRTRVMALNDHDHAVGSFETAPKGVHAFYWGYGRFTDIATGGELAAVANDINDADQVVGRMIGPDDAAWEAVVWTSRR